MSPWILELAAAPDGEVRQLKSVLESEGWEVYLSYPKFSVDKSSSFLSSGGYLLLTDDAARARRAAREKLPVIYYERPGSVRVYEADITVLGLNDLDSTFFKRTFQRHYGIPWTIAETPRLLIRESTEEDFEGLMKLYEDMETRMELYRDQMASEHFRGQSAWTENCESMINRRENCGEGVSWGALAEELTVDREVKNEKLRTLDQETEPENLRIFDQKAKSEKLCTLDQEAESEKLRTLGQNPEPDKLLALDQEAERGKFLAYLCNQYPYYGYGLYTVIQKDSGEIVARIGFENRTYQEKQYLELGYLVGRPYRKQGIALEASLALADVMEELTGEKSACIFCRYDNFPSRRTAEKFCHLRPDRFHLILVK